METLILCVVGVIFVSLFIVAIRGRGYTSNDCTIGFDHGMCIRPGCPNPNNTPYGCVMCDYNTYPPCGN